jgi:hypothetical protein
LHEENYIFKTMMLSTWILDALYDCQISLKYSKFRRLENATIVRIVIFVLHCPNIYTC